jgi:nucleotide-binding universal stress UspA family protein
MSLASSTVADGSEEATLASSAAAELARGTDSELHLVYVEPVSCKVYEMTEMELSGEGLPGELEPAVEKMAESRLRELLRKIGEAGAQIAGTHARVPRRGDCGAGRLGDGLIDTGSRGRGSLRRALRGSIFESGVRHASCPILVVCPGR